jgi:prepilin-type N-terminal cleavage/methylation domain-containing protein
MEQMDRMPLQKIGNMSGIYKAGFTLIEILVAIALVSIMLAVVAPRLYSPSPEQIQRQFVQEVNGLVNFAQHNAIRNGTVQKVLFDLKKEVIVLEEATGDKKNGELLFKPVERAYRKTMITIPSAIEIKQFLIQGVNEMGRAGGRTVDQIWFYVLPDGTAQDVIINYIFAAEQQHRMSLVLNPFSAQFTRYDDFQQ